MNESSVIKKYLENENKRRAKSFDKGEFVVKSIQGESSRMLGRDDKPIYVILDGITQDHEGSLLKGDDYMFYVNKVSGNGKFTELFLFANEVFDFVDRDLFPKKLIEIC